jgi:hypothetical protein
VVGLFRLPSDVCPPSERLPDLRGPFLVLRHELVGTVRGAIHLPSAFRQPSLRRLSTFQAPSAKRTWISV